MDAMDAADLGRWTRFAAKGGIGKCTALKDRVAEGTQDLMFLAGDEIVVLMQLTEENVFLGYCEGVVGRFLGSDVQFHGKLKKPVKQKRSSASASVHSTSPVPSPPILKHDSISSDHPSTRLSLPVPRKTYMLSPEDADVPVTSRSSIVTSPESALPQTPNDITSVQRDLSKKRRGGMIDTRSVTLPARLGTPETTSSVEKAPSPSPIDGSSPGLPLSPSPSSFPLPPQNSAPYLLPTAPPPPRTPTPPLVEDSSRISAAFSEGEIEGKIGIGLTLLGGMGSDDEESRYEDDEEDEADNHDNSTVHVHQTVLADIPVLSSSPEPPLSPPPPLPPIVPLSPSSVHTTHTHTDDSDLEHGEWDGASDIYDNYRYSRYSLASKLSSRASRLSMLGGIVGTQPLPPMPDDKERERTMSEGTSHSAQKSIDSTSRRSLDAVSARTRTTSLSESSKSSRPLPPPRTGSHSHVPPPLSSLQPRKMSLPSTTVGSPGPSPLLHTGFESPSGSSHSFSSHSQSLAPLSPPISAAHPMPSPLLSPRDIDEGFRSGTGAGIGPVNVGGGVSPLNVGGGAASALRARLEEKRLQQLNQQPQSAEGESSQGVQPLSPTSPPTQFAEPTANPGVRGIMASPPRSPPMPRRKSSSRSRKMSAGSPGSPRHHGFVITNPDPPETDTSGGDGDVEAEVPKTPKTPSSPVSAFSRTSSTKSRPEPLKLSAKNSLENVKAIGSPQSLNQSQIQTPISTPTSVGPLSPTPSFPPSPSMVQNLNPPTPLSSSPLPEPSPPITSRSSPALPSTSSSPSPFLPHPLAPKPPSETSPLSRGPSIHRTRISQIINPSLAPVSSSSSPSVPPPPPPPPASQSLLTSLREAALLYTRPMNGSSPSPLVIKSSPKAPPGIRRAATIHGRTEKDLLSASGPVPISWLVDGWREREVDMRVEELPKKPAALNGRSQTNVPARQQSAPNASTSVSDGPGVSGATIPRANFSPTVGAQRPRSRSFSGFNANSTPIPPVGAADTNTAEKASSAPSVLGSPATISSSPVANRAASPSSTAGPSRPRLLSSRSSAARSPIGPSPLSLGASKGTLGKVSPTPSSPLARPPLSPNPASPTSPVMTSSTSLGSPIQLQPNPPRGVIRHFASSTALQTPMLQVQIPAAPAPPSVTSPTSTATFTNTATPSSPPTVRGRRNSGPAASSSITSVSQITQDNPEKPARDGKESKRSPSVDTSHSTEASHYSESIGHHSNPQPQTEDDRAQTPSASSPTSSMGRESLRNKLSISALRSRASLSQPKRDATPSRESSAPQTPAASTSAPMPMHIPEYEEETVQVKDMEFELVRPVLKHVVSRNSEDSAGLGTDVMSLRSEARPDILERSLSPATSMLAGSHGASGLDGRSPAASSVDSFGASRATMLKKIRSPTVEASAQMEAHRARELKWMSTIQSTSHKSKKLRKMLQEPVPSSVRYQVWSHLVDAKAKRMPNIYSDLSKRPRVGASANIEKDADRYFPEHPHLKDPRGPLVSLLNAYFAMVPDITYQAGLVIIAGHLLLQSPEEDAFWMFLALMDQHLRPYFSPGAYQLEADASLFQKYLEANDAPMSKRLFVNDVRPIDLCGPWFSSMFAGTLPTEHLCRVWDIFFYEGPVILFRVGLEILRIYRRRIFDSPASPAGSAWLTRPLPPTMLPDPETFLSDALSVKLKDDDLRKQRVKMEATIRKQQPGSSRGLTMNSTLIRKT